MSSKANPLDFDALWDSDGVSLDLIDPVLLDFSNKQAAQKRKFGGEMFPNLAAEQEELGLFRLFQTDKANGSSKGIIAIDLESFE